MRRACDHYYRLDLPCGHNRLPSDRQYWAHRKFTCPVCGRCSIALRFGSRLLQRRVPTWFDEDEMLDELNYEELDPGIRDMVRLLRDNRFETTDSGDGVSKPAEHRVLHFPHVFCRTDPRSLIGECDRMREVLVEAGLFVSDHNLEVETVETPDGLRVVPSRPVKGFRVEGSYNPDDMSAVIAVLGEPQQGDP